MRTKRSDTQWWVGIEGGGTKTTLLAEPVGGGTPLQHRFGPGNLKLLSNAQLLRLFRQIRAASPPPAALGIGLAGARTTADRQRIVNAAARVWPGVPCHVSHDLETALRAAPLPRRVPNANHPLTRVLLLCGTGSCCYGRAADGATRKLGGWGHLLGDKGSGHDIGLRALKAVVYYLDRDGTWSRLGVSLLRFLQLNEPEALIDWIAQARKDEVAALAPLVFEAARARDTIARDILEGAAHMLAKDALALTRRLAARQDTVQFVLAGGVFRHQAGFVRRIARLLQQGRPGSTVHAVKGETALGALDMAREAHPKAAPTPQCKANASRSAARWFVPDMAQLGQSPTEQRNPRSKHLDRLGLPEAVDLFLREEHYVTRALRKEQSNLVRGIEMVVRSLRRGGRLFYVGAGTSGRLGVLDASECPPTFQTPPDWVQGIMAGGAPALHRSIEGAEDDPEAGAAAMRRRGVDRHDIVVGIAASGRTPFVWGALAEARKAKAATILLTFNPGLNIPSRHRPGLVIAPRIGPELLTGSTRLKAGTATKLVLNLFTTLAMVRLGKVLGNLMVDVHPSNEKLRRRAIRIVQTLTGIDADPAEATLRRLGWNIRKAVAALPR